jgi:hypothetical protein
VALGSASLVSPEARRRVPIFRARVHDSAVSHFSAPVSHLLRSRFVALGFAFLGFLPQRAAVGLLVFSRNRAAGQALPG